MKDLIAAHERQRQGLEALMVARDPRSLGVHPRGSRAKLQLAGYAGPQLGDPRKGSPQLRQDNDLVVARRPYWEA